MGRVADLRAGWELEQASTKADKKGKKSKSAPEAEDEGLFPEAGDDEPVPSTANLFEDSDDDDDAASVPNGDSKSGDANGKGSDIDEEKEAEEPAVETTQQDLFGDSSDEESDEELVRASAKRSNEGKAEGHEQQPTKKRKVGEDEE